jgi:hypothetical protein
MSFFIEIEKSILKFIWKHKNPQAITKDPQAILNKESNAGGITVTDFKSYYKNSITKQH